MFKKYCMSCKVIFMCTIVFRWIRSLWGIIVDLIRGRGISFLRSKDGSMTTARRKTVNYDDTRWYHCISKIARGLWILDQYGNELKRRIEREISRLSSIFAIGVGGHAILGSHFHLLLQVDVEKAKGWSAIEVLSRWILLCPPKNKKREVLKGDELQFWVDEKSKDQKYVEERRKRLMDLGWFHRFLKQPLSIYVNKLEGCSGTLFQGRFKSIAVMDFQALLNVAIYIDLNPVAAGIVDVPEEAEHTSFRLRFENAIRNSIIPRLLNEFESCSTDSTQSLEVERALWLLSIENRITGETSNGGMFDDLKLIQYMMLVDEAGRIPREGKASISSKAKELLKRLGVEHKKWVKQLQRLSAGKLRGHYLSSSREELRRLAVREGKRCLVNLGGCPCND